MQVGNPISHNGHCTLLVTTSIYFFFFLLLVNEYANTPLGPFILISRFRYTFFVVVVPVSFFLLVGCPRNDALHDSVFIRGPRGQMYFSACMRLLAVRNV